MRSSYNLSASFSCSDFSVWLVLATFCVDAFSAWLVLLVELVDFSVEEDMGTGMLMYGLELFLVFGRWLSLVDCRIGVVLNDKTVTGA
jgi:hypothetical protein